jgi:DNA-binding GntR family transcriptional regulator
MAEQALDLGFIERRTLNELAYDSLKRVLLSGRLEPGRIVTLRQLAEGFGTSIMPVREAVARLAAEQAVEVLPNRGIRVPALSARDWREIWELRVELEGEAAGRAALEATPEDLAVIQTNRDRVREAAESGLLHETLETNSELQFAIYEAARTRVLVRFVETLRMQCVPHCTDALRHLLTERPPFLKRTLDHHDSIVEAIVRHDPTEARRAKQRDLEELRAFVEQMTPR